MAKTKKSRRSLMSGKNRRTAGVAAGAGILATAAALLFSRYRQNGNLFGSRTPRSDQ